MERKISVICIMNCRAAGICASDTAARSILRQRMHPPCPEKDRHEFACPGGEERSNRQRQPNPPESRLENRLDELHDPLTEYRLPTSRRCPRPRGIGGEPHSALGASVCE